MLTWISEQAKWVIYIFIVFIIIGLLFMDMSQLRTNPNQDVAKVENVTIPAEYIRNLLKQRIQQRQRQGQPALTDVQMEEERNNLLREEIQRILLGKEFQKNGIVASVREMQLDLRDDPPQGVRQSPAFQTDSVFDQKKYEAWLAKDSIYDMPEVQQLEAYLQRDKIPYKQLQTFVGAGYHLSDLEASFDLLRRENRFQAEFFLVSGDSFPADTIDDQTVQSYFESLPDSFRVESFMRRFEYAKAEVEPSLFDDKNTLDYAEVIRNQLVEGADFGEVARSVSDDLGSAKNGGELGDFTSGANWVKSFREAALALDSGELSQPVRSQYGYHVLLCRGKRIAEDGSPEVKISHLLLKVTPGTETMDSLDRLLEDVRTDVLAGKTLADAAKIRKLEVGMSSFVERGKVIPELGYLSGLSAFGFADLPGDVQPVSRVMRNRQVVTLLAKADSLQEGERLLELVKDRLRARLEQKSRVKKAAAYLEEHRAELTSGAGENTFAKHDTTRLIGADSYFDGLGYGSEKVWTVMTQKDGSWGAVLSGERGAVLAKVLKREVADTTGFAARVMRERNNSARYAGPTIFGDYMKNVEAAAEIVNNIDAHF